MDLRWAVGQYRLMASAARKRRGARRPERRRPADPGPTEVLIIGAGPTGLALACQCLRLGVRVRVVDRKPGPSTTSKAIGLQYRVSEVLACMGVADRFLARGGTQARINVYAGRRHLVGFRFAGAARACGRDAFAPRPIIIPQSETEALLGDLLRERAGRVEWGTEFLAFEQDAERVVAGLRHADGRQEAVACRWLVSCEGAHSRARKQAGIALAGKTYPLAFVLADVELSGPLDHDQHHAWVHPEGSFAALALPGERTFRLMVEVTRQADRLAGGVTADLLRELAARRTGGIDLGIGAPTWTSEYRIHCRMADRYRHGRVLLAGDAAHIHSPTGGQGIATGIQDATNLAWKLARVLRGAPEALLDTYEEERLPQARSVLHETDKVTTLLTAPTWRARLLRDWLLLPVIRHPWVQKALFGRMAQLHVHYRASRLSRHEAAGGWLRRPRVRAGDRAPDVAFAGPGGRRVTLFELLQRVRPVALIGAGPGADAAGLGGLLRAFDGLDIDAYLLLPQGDPRWPTSPRCLRDVHGDFAAIYGMAGSFLCLVRPDGHVGLFQRPVDAAALRDYLGLLSPADAVARAFGDPAARPIPTGQPSACAAGCVG